jgi:hypothetical protein
MTGDPHSGAQAVRGARGIAAAATLACVQLLQSAAADQRFVELGAGRGLTASVVNAMLIDRDGLLWVGSREGLFRYDGYEATAALSDRAGPAGARDLDVRALYEADDGALWVGTLGGGVMRRDPLTGRFRQYGHDPADTRSLSDPDVLDVAQDGEGNVWVTTRNGLNRLDADLEGFTRYHQLPEPMPDLGRHRASRLLRRATCGSRPTVRGCSAGTRNAGNSRPTRWRRSPRGRPASIRSSPWRKRATGDCGSARGRACCCSIHGAVRRSS